MSRAVLSRFAAASVAALLSLAALSLARADDQRRDEFYRSLGSGSAVASTADGPTALLVSGVLGPGSYEEFRLALMRGEPELVVIDGPGGVLGEALMIGEEVRRRQLNTMVAARHSCASACAIVFLSGRNKYVGPGAVIGLHSASTADGRADPEATELMAKYLSAVGVPGSTLRRMARTAPNDIRWLTKAEQKALGIKLLSDAR
jgi:hypothetical protein